MTQPMELRDHIARHRDRIYLVDANTDRSWNYAQFDREVQSLAGRLQELGIQPGDRVAAVLSNSPAFVCLYFAVLRLGAIVATIQPNLPTSEIGALLQIAGARLIVVNAGTKAPNPSDLPILEFSEATDQDLGEHSWVMGAGAGSSDKTFDDPSDPNAIWTITFTSGTTSQPKGVPHRSASLWSSAIAFSQALGYGPGTRMYHVLPMGYMAGFLNTLLCPFVVGGSVVIDRPFDARRALDFWSPVERHRVNRLCLVPTMLSMLLHLERSHKGPAICRERIEGISVCTAPLPPNVKERFEEQYQTSLYESYGLSETLFVTTQRPGEVAATASVGQEIDGVHVSIRDEQQQTLPLTEEGEVYVESSTMMAGYWDSTQGQPNAETAPACFPTGDLGYLTADRHLVITGRRKDLIIRGGSNVSPRAIEETLRHVAGVRDIAVVGTPHELQGEEVVAVIEVDCGTTWYELHEQLIQFSRDRLSESARPNRFIEITELPRNNTGKIQKHRVRDMLARRRTPGVPA